MGKQKRVRPKTAVTWGREEFSERLWRCAVMLSLHGIISDSAARNCKRRIKENADKGMYMEDAK